MTAARTFTPEQRLAVDTRGVSVSLSAGAGCGKTFVLTERYLAHFDPRAPGALAPGDIGQLVAITFTERAAREMRERIRAACYDRLGQAAPQDVAYWIALLRALDAARISTIHSFCAALLRRSAIEAELDPQFAVLEQTQAETLLSEALDDELRRLIADRDETIVELAVRYNLNSLRNMVRRLVCKCTPADFEHWLAVSPDEHVGRWQAARLELLPRLARELLASDEAQAVWQVLRENEPAHPEMRARRAMLLERFEALGQGPAAGELVDCLADVVEQARVKGGGTARHWPSEAAYRTFKSAAEKLRKSAGELLAVARFDAATARGAAEVAGRLLRVADRARRAYAARKTALRVLDFDDLIVQTRALLTDAKHRRTVERLSAGVTLLLVDEFQDTDPVQAELVQALCGPGLSEGKLFFVGDHKQSIYRFRGADPHVFRRLRERTPREGRQSLSLNFRSQPAILEFVNALFWDQLGEGYEPLRASRQPLGERPLVEFMWVPAAQARESVAALRRREADWIARRIRGLLDGGEPLVAGPDGASARPAQPGDVVLLLRALSDVEAYETALRRHGIDYYLVGGHAFYAQQEIFDLLNLLRALNSPADVVSLVGALRSGFFSLADETLYWLAQHPGGLAGGLQADTLPEEIGPEQRRRVAFAARTVARLRASKDRLRVCELIELALSLTGYDAALVGEFLGERKLANLLKLKEQARAFERGDYLGLADFITQLSEFVVRQPDEPLAATHSEDTNVVRLMSVHQAKGLEFPIVVVPDCNRRSLEPTAIAEFDARLGPLVRLAADDGDERPAAGGYDLWRQMEKAEEAAEARRLFYVATTRAADYLILSGGVNTPGDASGPWTQLLARRFDLASGRFTGSLPPGEKPPRVTLIDRQPQSRGSADKRQPRANIDHLAAEVAQARGAEGAAWLRGVEAVGPDAAARVQYSFSRLHGCLQSRSETADENERPIEFLTPQAHDPLGLGTLAHAALAVIDFARPGDCRKLVTRLAERHLPDRASDTALAADMIERFVASPRARELAEAQVSHAEIEFLLGWPPGGPETGRTVLRGFIDRLYQDRSGAWHVLDFKTNRVDATNLDQVAASYEVQMLVYALAAERMLAAPPASLRLHFLRTGAERDFAWNDAARRNVVALVEQAIANLRSESA